MQTAITPTYTFSPANNTIDFTAMSGGFNISLLYSIINLRTCSYIYNVGDRTVGITSANGSVLTLRANVSNMLANDPLMIIYEVA